jgi:4-hydroxy-tetrahydrodipicolinate synthase
MMKDGFYTALGTPLNADGRFMKDSFIRQVEDQVRFGASGLLVMGSMGLGVFIRQDDYVNIARTAVSTAKNACPVFIGVTDTSIGRTLDRVKSLYGLQFDGIVATTPYYYTVTDRELVRFYTMVADCSPFPLYLYDLPAVSKNKITMEIINEIKSHPNIRGIKTADLDLALSISNRASNDRAMDNFSILYSGLDTFNKAYDMGITRNLDGMFACTGILTEDMYRSFAQGDMVTGSVTLNKIINLRNVFSAETVFPSFTYAMNLLGYEGSYHPDYLFPPSEGQKEKIRFTMSEIGLL